MTGAKFEYSSLISQGLNHRSLMLVMSHVRSALCTLTDLAKSGGRCPPPLVPTVLDLFDILFCTPIAPLLTLLNTNGLTPPTMQNVYVLFNQIWLILGCQIRSQSLLQISPFIFSASYNNLLGSILTSSEVV